MCTVAVQSATGSGKTLVMHAHILQYRRIARAAGRPPRNVILVTPNEQLSEQHERELLASNLPARIFSSGAVADLLAPVEIIDVNKLAEKQGVKRVAVRDFGDNNLVLVDEGHLGSSGKAWRARRFADVDRTDSTVNVAVELIADYAAKFWRGRRREWEYENLEVGKFDKSDPNNIVEYRLSVDAREEHLIKDIHAISTSLPSEGPVPTLGFGILMRDEHAYKPLLHAVGKSVVTVQPVLLNIDEKRVVECLTDLAKNSDPCLRGWEGAAAYRDQKSRSACPKR